MIRPQAFESESNDTFSLKNDSTNDDDFEFPRVFGNSDTCPVTADEIFSNGKLLPIFTNSSNEPSLKIVSKPPVKSSTRRSLSSLFMEDKDFDPPSCSSSETSDEFDGVARDTYCQWAPEKSKSTGTSRRWKFKSILKRCNSDNRDGFIIYDVKDDKIFEQKTTGKSNAMAVGHYASKRAEKDEYRRRSFLPYKTDLIGLFSNINR